MVKAFNDPTADCCGRDVADCDCPKYVATVNVPGYLPMDDEPPVFDTARGAWEYLAEERERGEDDYEGEEYSATRDILAALGTVAHWQDGSPVDILREHGLGEDGTGTVYGDTPGYDGSHDLGLAYSVTIAE